MQNREFAFAPKIEYKLVAERSEANLSSLQFPTWCSILELVRTAFTACGGKEVPQRKFGKAAPTRRSLGVGGESRRSKPKKNPEKNIGSNHILILGEENFFKKSIMRIDHIFDTGSSKEDSYLIRDNLFAVFDGFNSLDGFDDRNGLTGGLIAATIAKDTFSGNEGTLKNLAMEATRKIREKILDSKIDTKNKDSLWGTIFAAVRIKSNSFEWAQLADSLILVIFKDNSHKLLVEDFDHDGEVLTIWKQLAAQRKENIRKLIAEPLAKLRAKTNETYGVLNGEESVESFLKTGEENLQNVKHILLFTDGLMIPKEDPLGKDDWKLFVDLFLQGGLENVKNFVRNLQKDDPKCWKYPRYKQYDDITAISLTF